MGTRRGWFFNGRWNRSAGAALVAAIIFGGLVAFMAAFLLQIIFNRVTVYSQSRDHQYSQIASAAALSELNSCFYNLLSWPPAAGSPCPPPPATSNWTCDGSQCYRITTENSFQFCLVATWPANNLKIDACPYAGSCPTTCPLIN